jgi:hypothetical protein
MPERIVLTAADRETEVSPEVEVWNPRGERLARYALRDVVGSCVRQFARRSGPAVDYTPAVVVVDGGRLPESFTLSLQGGEPCSRHGWHCPHWVRTALYVREKPV